MSVSGVLAIMLVVTRHCSVVCILSYTQQIIEVSVPVCSALNINKITNTLDTQTVIINILNILF